MADDTRTGGGGSPDKVVVPISPDVEITMSGGSGGDETRDVAGDDMPTTEPPSRDEMNARIEAVEARLDTKVSELRGDIREGFAEMKALLSDANNRSQNALNASERLERAVSNTRWQLIGIAIAAVIIILTTFGIWQQGIEIIAGVVQPTRDG